MTTNEFDYYNLINIDTVASLTTLSKWKKLVTLLFAMLASLSGVCVCVCLQNGNQSVKPDSGNKKHNTHRILNNNVLDDGLIHMWMKDTSHICIHSLTGSNALKHEMICFNRLWHFFWLERWGQRLRYLRGLLLLAHFWNIRAHIVKQHLKSLYEQNQIS